MGVYAFCPRCEERVMVGLQRFELESAPEKSFHFLYCGKCDLVLNMDRWVHVTVVPYGDEDEVERVSGFWVRVLNLLPRRAHVWINAITRRVTGSYFMPDPTTEMDVPEFVDSIITQVEQMSGEKFSGDPGDFEAFMSRGIDAIVQAGGPAHA